MKKVIFEPVLVIYVLTLLPGVAPAQEPTAEDQTIDTIRRLSNIGPLDQDRIKQWLQLQVDRLAGARSTAEADNPSGEEFKKFRQRIVGQFNNANNTPEFRAQFAAQTSAIASAEFAKPKLDATVAWSLAHALLDMQRQPEATPGLLDGLKSNIAIARYLCARGLEAQRPGIVADKEKLTQVVRALRTAGAKETDPTVLGRIYGALAYVDQPATVFDAFMELLDARLSFRRQTSHTPDGADIAAFEFFRNPKVLSALDQNQKAELVRRLAVLLRMETDLYRNPALAPPVDGQTIDLTYPEREYIERNLDALEEILAAVVGDTKGGKIRDALATGGYQQREVVVREAHKWAGNTTTNEGGVLNDAPWNVPLGAP